MVQPVAGAGSAPGNGAWLPKPSGWSNCSPNAEMKPRVVEEHVAGPADEVGGHAAAGEEAPEVDRRALDRGVAAAGPLHLGDLEAAALGGLGDRLGLQHAGVEGGGPVAERVAVLVERVVGRAVDAGPGTGGQGVPAGAGVGRRLGEHAVAGRAPRCGGRTASSASGPGRRTSRPGPGAVRRRRRTPPCRAAGHSAPPDWTVAGAEAVGAADVAATTTPDATSTRAPDRAAGRKLDRKLDRNTRISST